MTSPRRRLVAETALLVACLVGGAAVCRMIAGGLGGGAVGPVLVTTAVGWVLPTVLVRLRAPGSLAAFVGTLGVALSTLWTTVPRATTDGAPTLQTFHVVRLDLRHARSELATFKVPLHAVPGVVLLGALLAGTVAVVARTLFERPGSERTGSSRLLPAAALLFPLGLVAWSSVAAADDGSALLVAVFVAIAAATVILCEPGPVTTLEGRSRRRVRAVPTIAVTAVAMIAAVAVGVSIGSQSGASAVSPGPSRAAAVPPTDLSLASDLVGLERKDPSVVLFTARTPFATYWQVGVLNVYRHRAWVPDPATEEVLNGRTPTLSPAVLPDASERTFTATVTMAQLTSRLVPVAQTTVSVGGPVAVEVTSIGAVATRPPLPGQRLRVTAIVPPTISATNQAAGPSLPPQQLKEDLTLPQIPTLVSSLARSVTATESTPLARAEALVNWFRSGLFHYTLRPPSAPAGADPLTFFLTTSRSGTCESFADAFAVMARSIGLPTRVAVGFTGGRRSSSGTTVVSGADAHAWPEVYLGAASGWVSFEPTPELPSGELAPASVIGPTGISPPIIAPTPTSTPTPRSIPISATTTPPQPTSTVAPTTVPTIAPTTVVAPAPTRTTTGDDLSAVILSVVVGILVLVVIFAVWRRRRRRGAAIPRQRVLTAYLRVDRALADAGLPRPSWRAPTDHANALVADAQLELAASTVPAGDELLAALTETHDLALVLERAFYSPWTPQAEDVGRAETTAKRIRRTLRRRSVRTVARTLTVRSDHRRPRGEPRMASPTAPKH
jgi:transglutaminase-like putative cysteine protease